MSDTPLQREISRDSIRREEIASLLQELSEAKIKFPPGKKSISPEEFGKACYAHPTGKRVLETLLAKRVGGATLSSLGFIPASIGIGHWLDIEMAKQKVA